MKKVAALLALVLAAFALVACGDDDGTTTTTTNEPAGEAGAGGGGKGGGGAASSTALKFETPPAGQLAFTTTEASTKAGEVTIEFNNPQPLPHDVAIEDPSGKTVGKTELVTESSTKTTVELKPGTYTFYCSVPGHREAGMEGTLKAQ